MDVKIQNCPLPFPHSLIRSFITAESGRTGVRREELLQVHGGAGPLRAAALLLQGQDGRQPALVARKLQEGSQGQVGGSKTTKLKIQDRPDGYELTAHKVNSTTMSLYQSPKMCARQN